jgi:uncharacterized protein
MKVEISKLSKSRELEFSEEWDPVAYDLGVDGWQYEGPVSVEVFFKKDSGLATSRVHLKAALALTCSRCHKDFKSFLDKTFSLAYSIDLSEKFIEPDDDIREELILNYPQKILCRDDCLGLCMRCGADQNEKKCKHES